MKNNYESSQCDNKSHWEIEGRCKNCVHCQLDDDVYDYFCRNDGSCCGHVQGYCTKTKKTITFNGDCLVQS